MVKRKQGEIVLPETQPETEWLRGRAVQKVSPKLAHGELQIWLGGRLRTWAARRGRVGSEWRFRISPPGEAIRPLVPDISYLSYERMRGATKEEWQAPLVAPDAAIEIRSPDDRLADLDDKIATLLLAGTLVVVVVDPRTRTVTAYDATGTRAFTAGETFEHSALPGFSVAVDEMFAETEFEPPG
jgi:Uma2 family endonuclease